MFVTSIVAKTNRFSTSIEPSISYDYDRDRKRSDVPSENLH